MEYSDNYNIVQKVINSQTFLNKEVLKGLLEFLYNAAIKGVTLKEIDIAIDYFKRDSNFISGDDTIVRVNIHKLRLLLEKYYNNEGKKDKIQIEIPKGSYTVRFFDKISNLKVNATRSKSYNLFLLIFLILSIVINIVLFVNPLNTNKPNYHPVWNDYINSYKPVCIILGDPFFFAVDDSINGRKALRDVTINSVEDLKQKNYRNFKSLKYPYFSKNNVLPLSDIISVISQSKKDIYMQALSEVNVDNIKNNNQIFIANINSFGFYEKFLEKSSIKISCNPRQIILNTKTDSIFYEVPEVVEGYYNDYAFMVKVPGPNNNIITMLGDFHASGNKGLSSLLKDKNKIKTLEKSVKEEYKEFPKYFEMIVKVSSFHYADFKTEVVYFKKLYFEETERVYFPDMMY